MPCRARGRLARLILPGLGSTLGSLEGDPEADAGVDMELELGAEAGEVESAAPPLWLGWANMLTRSSTFLDSWYSTEELERMLEFLCGVGGGRLLPVEPVDELDEVEGDFLMGDEPPPGADLPEGSGGGGGVASSGGGGGSGKSRVLSGGGGGNSGDCGGAG